MFSANQIIGYFNQPYLQSKSVKELDFFACYINLHNLKLIWKIWVGMVRNGCGQSGHKALELPVSQDELMKWTDLLHVGANLWKLKPILLIFEWAWTFSSLDPKICWMSVWIEVIFSMLTVMQYLYLDKHCTLYLWLLKASLLQLY